MFLQALLPPIKDLFLACVWRCTRALRPVGGGPKGLPPTQRELNLYHTPPHLSLTERYANLLSVTFICLLYSTGIPILYTVVFVAVALRYYVDVLLLVYHYRRPPREDMSLAVDAVTLLPLALIGHLWIGAWMLSALFVYAYNGGALLGVYGVIPAVLANLLPPGVAAEVAQYANGAGAAALVNTPASYATAVVARGTIPYVLPAVVFGGVWALLYVVVYGLGWQLLRPALLTAWAVGTLPLRSAVLCCHTRCGACAPCVPWASASAEGEDALTPREEGDEETDKGASLASAPRKWGARWAAPPVDPRVEQQRRHVHKWLTKEVAGVVLADKHVEARLASGPASDAPLEQRAAAALGYDPVREERWASLWRSGDFAATAAAALPPDRTEPAAPCCGGCGCRRTPTPRFEGDVSVDGASRLVRAPLYSRAVALGLFAGSSETYAPLQNCAVSEALFGEPLNLYYRTHSSLMEPDLLRLEALGRYSAFSEPAMGEVRRERVARWTERLADQRRAAADAAGLHLAEAREARDAFPAAPPTPEEEDDPTTPWGAPSSRPPSVARRGGGGPPPNPFLEAEEEEVEEPPTARPRASWWRGHDDE